MKQLLHANLSVSQSFLDLALKTMLSFLVVFSTAIKAQEVCDAAPLRLITIPYLR